MESVVITLVLINVLLLIALCIACTSKRRLMTSYGHLFNDLIEAKQSYHEIALELDDLRKDLGK